jgi:hypothetical protein
VPNFILPTSGTKPIPAGKSQNAIQAGPSNPQRRDRNKKQKEDEHPDNDHPTP